MSKIQPNTIPSKRLAKTLKQTDMVLYLNNLNTWPLNDDSDNPLDLLDFGERLFAVIRDNLNKFLEIIELDPTTLDFGNNSIDILKRGMGFNGDILIENANLKRDWIAGKNNIVELGTDVPQFFRFYVNADDDNNFTGDNNFEQPITSNVSEVIITQNFTFTDATKRIVDNDTTGTLGSIGQVGQTITITGTASNNGSFTIAVLVGVDEIEVEETLVDETITATITLPSQALTQFDGDEYINKNFLDSETDKLLPLDATRSMTGELDFGTNKAINLVDPTADQDAATKKYVDDIAIAGAPNASETVKGIVEEATLSEAIAGTDIGGTGAKLFVPPSKLQQTSGVYPNITAGEDIAYGQAVFIANGDEEGTSTEQYASGIFDTINSITSYFSQTFTTGTRFNSNVTVRLKMSKFSTPTGNMSVQLRATSGGLPTGPSLDTILFDVSTLTGSIHLTDFDFSIDLDPSTEYAIVFDPSALTVDGSNTILILRSTGNVYPDGQRCISADGTTWSGTPFDWSIRVLQKLSINNVYLSGPGVSGGKIDGLSITTALAGGACNIKYDGIVSGLAGLTSGVRYYVDTTSPGDITTTYTGDLIGVGTSTTSLLLHRVNVSTTETSSLSTGIFPKTGLLSIRVSMGSFDSFVLYRSISEFEYDSNHRDTYISISVGSGSGTQQPSIHVNAGDYLALEGGGTVSAVLIKTDR